MEIEMEMERERERQGKARQGKGKQGKGRQGKGREGGNDFLSISIYIIPSDLTWTTTLHNATLDQPFQDKFNTGNSSQKSFTNLMWYIMMVQIT